MLLLRLSDQGEGMVGERTKGGRVRCDGPHGAQGRWVEKVDWACPKGHVYLWSAGWLCPVVMGCPLWVS